MEPGVMTRLFLPLLSPPQRQGLQNNFLGREPESGPHHLEQLLVACTGFLIGESRLHIEFHAEHRAPRSEVLEQNHAAFRFADHNATTSLRAVSTADQFEAVNVIAFGAASHVLNQLGVSSLLPFDFGELPSDVVELHLISKVKTSPSTEILSSTQPRQPQPASGAQGSDPGINVSHEVGVDPVDDASYYVRYLERYGYLRA